MTDQTIGLTSSIVNAFWTKSKTNGLVHNLVNALLLWSRSNETVMIIIKVQC